MCEDGDNQTDCEATVNADVNGQDCQWRRPCFSDCGGKGKCGGADDGCGGTCGEAFPVCNPSPKLTRVMDGFGKPW